MHRLSGFSRCQRQTDEIPDRDDPGVTELPQPEQILVFADDEIRLGGGSTFENTVVGGVFSYDVQCLGRGDVVSECEQLAPRGLERIAIPLELIAEHPDRLGQYRV